MLEAAVSEKLQWLSASEAAAACLAYLDLPM